MNNPLQIRVVAVIGTACVLLLTTAARADDSATLSTGNIHFPIVKSIRVSGVFAAPGANAGFDFQVSNNGQYIFETGGPYSEADLKQTTTENSPALYYFGIWKFKQMIGWSPDNTQVAMTVQSDACAYPELESQVTLFNANTGKRSGFCIPISPDEINPISWSPFSNTTLFMQYKWLIDISSRAITDVPIPNVDPAKFSGYVDAADWTGLGQVLWDNKTEQPIGIVRYYDYRPGRAFYVCRAVDSLEVPDTPYCNQFYTIHDPSPIVYVGPNWELSTSGHFLLWMSSEIPQVILSQTPTLDMTQKPTSTTSPSPNPLFSPTPFPSITPFSL